jgi:acetyltransferase-like isoleucine patch superfamily enzyme/acyl carrier protein
MAEARHWPGKARQTIAQVRARLWLARCDRVGAHLALRGRPYIENLGRIELGDDFHLSSVPVQSHLATGPSGLIRIGDGVSIGHGASISAQGFVAIGSHSRIGPFVIAMDSDFHDVDNRSAPGKGRPIQVGREVLIGSRVTLLKGAIVGDGAQIASGSVVSDEIPSGARAGGVPARTAVDPGEHSADDPAAIPRLVRTTFKLAADPSLSDTPDRIDGWDSLGTLKLIIALEDAFEIVINEEEMLRARCVADLAQIVRSAQSRGQRRRAVDALRSAAHDPHPL